MELDYTPHARRQMRKHEITEAEVEYVVANPLERVSTDTGRDAYIASK